MAWSATNLSLCVEGRWGHGVRWREREQRLVLSLCSQGKRLAGTLHTDHCLPLPCISFNILHVIDLLLFLPLLWFEHFYEDFNWVRWCLGAVHVIGRIVHNASLGAAEVSISQRHATESFHTTLVWDDCWVHLPLTAALWWNSYLNCFIFY